jgi:hypothetical protein
VQTRDRPDVWRSRITGTALTRQSASKTRVTALVALSGKREADHGAAPD